MFEAMVIACLMGNPEQCKAFYDTRGPYISMEICKSRLEEMRQHLLSVYAQTMLLPHSGHCGTPKQSSQEKVSV
tara:strand:+ start:529 stop:750 length:222 start_codon:yes stop_codon:yes gene_type:complete